MKKPLHPVEIDAGKIKIRIRNLLLLLQIIFMLRCNEVSVRSVSDLD
jgi:hypothetical protein